MQHNPNVPPIGTLSKKQFTEWLGELIKFSGGVCMDIILFERRLDLFGAMTRYNMANWEWPTEWAIEYGDIMEGRIKYDIAEDFLFTPERVLAN